MQHIFIIFNLVQNTWVKVIKIHQMVTITTLKRNEAFGRFFPRTMEILFHANEESARIQEML